MKPGFWIMIAAVMALIGVALGAFGAHALQERFGEYERGVWQTATHYHLIHAVALFGFGVLVVSGPDVGSPALRGWIGGLFTAGILIFSGSLYALALSGVRVLGAITPIGGVAFLAGWALLARYGFLLGRVP